MTNLDEIRARLAAATPGPWVATEPTNWDRDEHDVLQSGIDTPLGCLTWDDHGGQVLMPSDATFIANAPTDIDFLLTLLDERDAQIAAVRELHRRAYAVFSWRDGRRFEDPCAMCDGKAGVHECGCWGETDVEYCCVECTGDSAQVAWPCPTILALDAKGGAS